MTDDVGARPIGTTGDRGATGFAFFNLDDETLLGTEQVANRPTDRD